MLGGLFGSPGSGGWESAPEGLRSYVRERLSSEQFEQLEWFLREYDVFSRVEPLCWQVDASMQARVLSLALLDVHWDFVCRNPSCLEGVAGKAKRSHRQAEARWLAYISLVLNLEPWNPAWSWNLYYGVSELSEDERVSHVRNTLEAADHGRGWYVRLLGREPGYELVFPEVRALAVWLQMELVLLKRLTMDEVAVFTAIMAREVDGVPVKRTLMRRLAIESGSSEEVVDFGLRAAGQVVHGVAQGMLSRFEFRPMVLVEKCAAAVNPRHLPSRHDLALLLRDLGRVDPGSGYSEEAWSYAREALELIDGGQYDLGVDAVSDAEELALRLAEMRGNMLDVLR